MTTRLPTDDGDPDLEAARYAAERAQRQYDVSDPENRLVTAKPERRWNFDLQHLGEMDCASSN